MKTPLDDIEQQLRTHYQQEFGEPSSLPQLLSRLDGHLPAQQKPLTGLQRVLQALPSSRLFVPSASRPLRPPQSASRRYIALAATLIVVLIGAAILTFSTVFRSGETFRLVLVPTEQASPAELAATRTILLDRFNSFGLKGVNVQLSESQGHPEILVDIPHFGGDETAVVNTLVTRGLLEFWDTGPNVLEVGTKLDPTQYTQYNPPAGKPRFTGQDLNPNSIFRDDETSPGYFGVVFAMKRSVSAAFYTFTQENTNTYLTITLDKKVLVSSVIVSAIDGPGSIQVASVQQADALVAALKYGALPVALQQQK